MPKPRVTAAVVVALILVGAIAATAVLLSDEKPKVLKVSPPDEVVEIHPDTLDRGPVTMDPEEPLVCMIDIDCLLDEVDAASDIAPTQPSAPAA